MAAEYTFGASWRKPKASTPLPSIEQIINLAKSGDSEAVTRLYEMHVDKIYRYVAFRVPTGEAEDITSDVFIKMMEGLPQFTYTGVPFEAWLYRIASARVADFYRQNRRTNHVELHDQIKTDNLQPEDDIISFQEEQKIRQQLQKLGGDQQTLLLLRFVERKSHQEVAQLMGKSVTAVKTMQHRALQRLAQLMGKDKKERYYLRGKDEPEQ